MYKQPLSTVFKINGGYCHILLNQIAFLAVEELPENAVLPSRPAPIPRIYFILTFFGLILLGLGIYGYFKDFIFESAWALMPCESTFSAIS
jgi:hypothetical protein